MNIQIGMNSRKSHLHSTIGFALAIVFILGAWGQVSAADNDNWVTTWATSPSNPSGYSHLHQGFEDVTLRQIVHTSIAGNRVRVRFSNVDGLGALSIGAARIAIRDEGATIVAESDRALTFDGSPTVIIPAGEFMHSDPVNLNVSEQVDLAISLYLPEPTGSPTTHQSSMQTNYIVESGDITGATSLQDVTEETSWWFLAAVEVSNENALGTVVVAGDSITDGTAPVDSNHRWPDILADRFVSHPVLKNYGIANAGLGGNRILYDTPPLAPIFGRSLLWRLERDVLATTGVTHVIVLIGINDITSIAGFVPHEEVTAEEMIQGFRQLIERVHADGVKVIGATMTPFKESQWFSEEGEEKRLVVNEWIRTSGEFDGLVDFDLAVRDPENPARFLPSFSEDMLHPNVDAYNAMVESIDLTLFE